MNQDEIENIFTYHPPFGSQVERYQFLRSDGPRIRGCGLLVSGG